MRTEGASRRRWVAVVCVVVAVSFGAWWLWRIEAPQSYAAGTTHAATLVHDSCVWEVTQGRYHWMASVAPATWGTAVRGRLHVFSDVPGRGGGEATFEAHGTRVDMVGGRDFPIEVNCGVDNAN